MPPVLASVTTPLQGGDSQQRRAVHRATPKQSCKASTSFGIRWPPQKQSNRTCDCVGGERKLAIKFPGCRRVHFPLKNENQAPGLAQERSPIALSCSFSCQAVPGLSDILQLGFFGVKNANAQTLYTSFTVLLRRT